MGLHDAHVARYPGSKAKFEAGRIALNVEEDQQLIVDAEMYVLAHKYQVLSLQIRATQKYKISLDGERAMNIDFTISLEHSLPESDMMVRTEALKFAAKNRKEILEADWFINEVNQDVFIDRPSYYVQRSDTITPGWRKLRIVDIFRAISSGLGHMPNCSTADCVGTNECVRTNVESLWGTRGQ